MRIVIASLILLAVNAALFVPGLHDLHAWVPLIWVVTALYLLIQGIFLLAKKEPVIETPTPVAASPKMKERDREVDAHVVHFLGLLQEGGRLVDFVMDDITSYSNEQVGAAARVVHQGCAKVIQEHFAINPVHPAAEGASVTLESGYDPASYRAVGKLAGSPPFHGTLLHHGWKTTKISLPRLTEKASGDGDLVIAPAEVEVKSS